MCDPLMESCDRSPLCQFTVWLRMQYRRPMAQGCTSQIHVVFGHTYWKPGRDILQKRLDRLACIKLWFTRLRDQPSMSFPSADIS